MILLLLTRDSLAALKQQRRSLQAMVHSPELFDMASKLGVDFIYVQTRGQVCLPGGMPLLTHLNAGKRFLEALGLLTMRGTLQQVWAQWPSRTV